MRRLWFLAAVSAVLLSLVSATQAQQIQGDYLETRSADVYTAACFANGEVGLVGNKAILAWRVSKGSFNNVPLDGLSVVAVAKANATLGDPFNNPYPAQALLIVDSKATPEQQDALISFAHKMGGRLLENIVRVEKAPISLVVQHVKGHPHKGVLRAGTLAQIETRPLGHDDHICGNEEVFYQPLALTAHAMPAVSLLDQFSGPGLGTSWLVTNKRNAFIGTFAQ